MDGISAIAGTGAALSALQFQVQYATRVASMQMDLINMQGDMALKLIASASVDPNVGTQLNVQV